MAQFRQHDVSQMYLLGQDVALTQMNNGGMGFPETDKDVSAEERADFYKGYHDMIADDATWSSKLAA